MVVLIIVSVFRLYPGFKKSFEHNSVRKKPLSKWMCLLGSGFFYVRWTKNINLWNHWLWKLLFGLCTSLLQIIQTLCNITRCRWSSSITNRRRTWLMLNGWSRSNLLFAWSRDWTIILSLHRNLSTLHFQFNRRLKQNAFVCPRFKADWEKQN